MEVKNWDFNNLKLDYGSFYQDTNHPGDIDLFYIARDNTLLIGELKNEQGTFKKGQRHVLEKLARGWKYDAVIIYITHSEYVQRGAKSVNVAECYVKEIYVKTEGKWRYPKRPTRVREVIEYFRRQNG